LFYNNSEFRTIGWGKADFFSTLSKYLTHDSTHSDALFIRGCHLSALAAFVLTYVRFGRATFAATANASTFGGFGGSMALFSGSILLYNNRNLQLLIVRLGMLVSLVSFRRTDLDHSSEGAAASWGVVVPFVNIVLAFLASKGIQKDEAKVRSLDRLR